MICRARSLAAPFLCSFFLSTVAVAADAPVPAGASPELQEVLRNWKKKGGTDSPRSVAEWKSVIAATDARRAEKIPRMLKRAGVESESSVIAGVPVFKLEPESIDPANKDRVFLYIHGGAYVFSSGAAGTREAIYIADRVEISVVSVDYRMPPDYPFPAAIDDIVAVYKALLEKHDPNTIVLGGTSAGGALALAVVHQLKKIGAETPGAIYAGTPWADLSKTGDTLYTQDGIDRILVSYDGLLKAAAELYADGEDYGNPLLSPVYGDFAGFPPTILLSGTRDLFLSDVVRTHRKLRAAGVDADLHVYEGMSHAGYIASPNTPESLDAYEELKAFVETHLR